MKNILFFILLFFLFGFNVKAQQISPYLYGQNHWMAADDDGLRPGYIHLLWPKVQESGVKLIRIGGNGYLQMPSRVRLNTMVDSIQAIGAEPLMQIPGTFTKEETKKLVEYYTKGKRKPVKFWCIGNEPLHKHHKIPLEQVYHYILKIAPVIKEVQPTAKVFVFDEASMIDEAYASLCGGDMDVCGKDSNGNWLVDGFTFHNYPNGRDFTRDDVIFSGPRKIEREIVALLAMMDVANIKHNRLGKDKLLWGLTEVNVTYNNPNRDIAGYSNPSFLGGQFIAEMYGLGARYGAFTVAPWCISEADRVHTDFGYLGLPEEFYPRSSYYHTQLMSKYMTGVYIQSETNQGYVKSIATMNNDVLSVMILNQDDQHDFKFDLASKDYYSVLPLNISLNIDFEWKYESEIRRESTLLLQFTRNGKLINRITYSVEDNLNFLSPKTNF